MFGIILFLSAICTLPAGWKEVPQDWHEFHAIKKVKAKVEPNASIASEPFEGSLDDYVSVVKMRAASQCCDEVRSMEVEDRGPIALKAGEGRLLKINVESACQGEVIFFQSLWPHDGRIYIVTAGASKEAFYVHVGDFLALIRSFSIDDE